MSIRTTLRLLAAALLAAAGTPPGLAAQDKPPESPARLGLPEDPEEVPRLVLASGLPIIHVFEADCPSEGGWGAAALAALEEAAETDTVLRSQLANTLGARVLARDLCLSDLPRFESWLADQLHRQWGDGSMGDEEGGPGEEDENPSTWPFVLLAYIGLSQDSATQALVRNIAMDSTVTDYWRGQAAQTMITQRYGEDLAGKDVAGRAKLHTCGHPKWHGSGPRAGAVGAVIGRPGRRRFRRGHGVFCRLHSTMEAQCSREGRGFRPGTIWTRG